MISNDLSYMLAFPPEREGYSFVLFRHPRTGLYQWINETLFGQLFGMEQIYPAPAPVRTGFGWVSFGKSPFGSPSGGGGGNVGFGVAGFGAAFGG